MFDARWSVVCDAEGKQVVRIVGQATTASWFCHERSGYSQTPIRDYKCYAMVTIPVQQLEASQSERHSYATTEGSGWSCGSENYRCAFFLPMCLVDKIRVPVSWGQDPFTLRQVLNKSGSASFPFLCEEQRYRLELQGCGLLKLKREHVQILKGLRECINTTRKEISVKELLELEQAAQRACEDTKAA